MGWIARSMETGALRQEAGKNQSRDQKAVDGSLFKLASDVQSNPQDKIATKAFFGTSTPITQS
jgi:hypothetical protein